MDKDLQKLIKELTPKFNKDEIGEVIRPSHIPAVEFEQWKKVLAATALIQEEMKDCHPLYVKHKLDGLCHTHGITVDEYFGMKTYLRMDDGNLCKPNPLNFGCIQYEPLKEDETPFTQEEHAAQLAKPHPFEGILTPVKLLQKQ